MMRLARVWMATKLAALVCDRWARHPGAGKGSLAIPGVALSLVLGGCTGGAEERIALTYEPLSRVAGPVEGAGAASLRVIVVDKRQVPPDLVASAEWDPNTYRVITTTDVVGLVRQAVTEELSRSGFHVTDASPAVLEVDIWRLYTSFAGAPKAEGIQTAQVTLLVGVFGPGGRLLLGRRVHEEYVSGLAGSYGRRARIDLPITLQLAMRDIITDRGILAAAIAASTPHPTGKKT